MVDLGTQVFFPGYSIMHDASGTMFLLERNLRYFKDVEDILASFFHTLYLWTVAFLSDLSLSFVDLFIRFSLPN
jgi:hypothetical protein